MDNRRVGRTNLSLHINFMSIIIITFVIVLPEQILRFMSVYLILCKSSQFYPVYFIFNLKSIFVTPSYIFFVPTQVLKSTNATLPYYVFSTTLFQTWNQLFLFSILQTNTKMDIVPCQLSNISLVSNKAFFLYFL